MSNPNDSGGLEESSGETTMSGAPRPCSPFPEPRFVVLFSDFAATPTVLTDFADLPAIFVETRADFLVAATETVTDFFFGAMTTDRFSLKRPQRRNELSNQNTASVLSIGFLTG